MLLRDFFYFNRSDRAVLLFFLSLATVAVALVFWLGGEGSNTPLTAADSLSVRDGQSRSAYPRYPRQGGVAYYDVEGGRPAPERFPFDPNTADSTALLRLGLRPWQVRNIYRYRAAGGIYRHPSDFARLYGLTQKDYRSLEPYIRISSDYAPAAALVAARPAVSPDTLPRYTPKLKPTEHVPLNEADTSLLKRVPGIGSYYARRIVAYRDRLGGFYDPAQLLEIDQFPENAISFFTVSNNIRKINVNVLKLNELRRHPYLNYYQARAITDYRRLRGPLKSLDDLRLVNDFTARDIERLRPYVEF